MTAAANSGVSSSSRRRRAARLPWWKKLVFAILATVLFFALLEGALWLAGVQPVAATEDPYVGFAGSAPLFVEEFDSHGRATMVTAPGKLAWFNEQRFYKEKLPGTRRVFCVGGSTTYGRPYDHLTAFSGWLAELLPLAAPDARWEVINAGGVSYASYRVTNVMRELAQYEPDLFIVYTGHNEFLEDRTYGALRDKPAALLETAGLLSRTRTFSVLHRLANRKAQSQPQSERVMLPGEVDAMLDHSVGPSSYERESLQRPAVLAHFHWNLERMIAVAEQCGAEIVFVVPAANLKDCSPFKSEHRNHLREQKLSRWQVFSRQAVDLEAAGEFAAALANCDAALAIDDQYAATHFQRGRILLALERPAEATAAFERAVDEDVCPLRAPAAYRLAVRDVAEAAGAPVVDFELLIKNDCLTKHGHNAPGEEYFLDHVHPTIDVHGLLSGAILDALRDDGGLGALKQLTREERAIAAANVNARTDPRDHAVALRNLAKVLNWAGKHEEAGRLAYKSLEVLPDDPESLLIAGAWLKSRGREGEAIDHLQRSVARMPDYADARQLLGAMLVDAGKLEHAHAQFTFLTKLRPDDAHAWQMLGAIRAEQRRYADSLPYYRRALEISPDDANLHYNLGFALLSRGRPTEAATHFRRALELNPSDTQAREQLERLNNSVIRGLDASGNDP